MSEEEENNEDENPADFEEEEFPEDIDEEEARALGTFQGTNLSVVLPEDRQDISSYVRSVCENFLKFVRLKNEFLGTRVVKNKV